MEGRKLHGLYFMNVNSDALRGLIIDRKRANNRPQKQIQNLLLPGLYTPEAHYVKFRS